MVHHQGDVDGIVDGLVVVVQLFLVGSHVPGSDDHDAVGAVGLGGLAHLDDVAGAVSAGGGNDLDAVLVTGLDVGLVNRHLLFLGHGDHFAGGAGGDDAVNAVFRQELGNLVDRGKVDGLVLIERGHYGNINTGKLLSSHFYVLLCCFQFHYFPE